MNVRAMPRSPTAGTSAAPDPHADRDFRKLWAGQSTSLVGDHVMVVALPFLAIGALHADAAQVALLASVLTLPFLLVGLPAGAIVERLPRRAVMIVSDIVQLAAYGSVAVLAAFGLLAFWGLLALVAVAGVAAVFFEVAYTSYLPLLYGEPRRLHRANTRLFLSESLARALGPSLAGVVVAVLGAVLAVAGNAGSFLVSLTALAMMRNVESRSATAAPRARGWVVRDVRDGLRFVFAHPQLEPVILCGTVYVLFLTMINASLVVYCGQVLGLGPAGVGLVIGAAAAGLPIGNLLSGRVIAHVGAARALASGAGVSVLGIVVMPVAGSLGSAVGLVIGSVVHGIGEGVFGPTSLTLRQTASPPHLLGRVQSVQRFLIGGSLPIGAVLAAATISLAGLDAAVWIGGMGTVLCLPVLLRRGIRSAVFPTTTKEI